MPVCYQKNTMPLLAALKKIIEVPNASILLTVLNMSVAAELSNVYVYVYI